jgi:hypothetical protein
VSRLRLTALGMCERMNECEEGVYQRSNWLMIVTHLRIRGDRRSRAEFPDCVNRNLNSDRYSLCGDLWPVVGQWGCCGARVK